MNGNIVNQKLKKASETVSTNGRCMIAAFCHYSVMLCCCCCSINHIKLKSDRTQSLPLTTPVNLIGKVSTYSCLPVLRALSDFLKSVSSLSDPDTSLMSARSLIDFLSLLGLSAIVVTALSSSGHHENFTEYSSQCRSRPISY